MADAKAKICTDIEMYYKTACPYCDGRNWVCAGDISDVTGLDVEAVECRICGKRYWLGNPMIDGIDTVMAVCEKGRGLDEL